MGVPQSTVVPEHIEGEEAQRSRGVVPLADQTVKRGVSVGATGCEGMAKERKGP